MLQHFQLSHQRKGSGIDTRLTTCLMQKRTPSPLHMFVIAKAFQSDHLGSTDTCQTLLHASKHTRQQQTRTGHTSRQAGCSCLHRYTHGTLNLLARKDLGASFHTRHVLEPAMHTAACMAAKASIKTHATRMQFRGKAAGP
jgi:hypothetical protein